MTTNFESGGSGQVSADGYIQTVTNSLTAFAGGGQASATLLKAGINVVTTVATAADSVKLPLATQVGQAVVVVNADSTDSMQVFGSGTDTINGVATATGVAQAAGKVAVYYCTTKGAVAPDTVVAGAWFRDLSA
ncbi:MAG: hypothetical protein Q7T61_01000 [Caulobacter sp.]|nr:hypothetical protein [Caulobacter sp.]